MSSMGSENSATSCPSDLPTLTYLVIVLMARAERSNLDTINSLIRSSNAILDLPAPEVTHDIIQHSFAPPAAAIEAIDHCTVSAKPVSNETRGCHPSNCRARVLSASTCRCSPDRPGA